METRDHIRFVLNDREITARPPASQTLLDFIRLDRRLTGTKEGCAEGDCGACTVLLGRLTPGGLVYETVNTCIRLVASCDATHVVTIEHLARRGELHPVQQALVEHHGSQCGFCTPGIVMSLYALWMANPKPSARQIETALQGNLCRCTGYAPIVRAAQNVVVSGTDPLTAEREAVATRLRTMSDGARIAVVAPGAGGDEERSLVPADVDDLATLLRENEDATIVSGSTDVGLWVAKNLTPISPAIFISHLSELREVDVRENEIEFGSGVSYSDFATIVAEHYPTLQDLWHRIGGEQVRNMGTLGGNIANGSPIGDTPPFMIALGATLVLRSASGLRELPLEDFFLEYGKQDLRTGEFVHAIRLPRLRPNDLLHVSKISKRREEDISALCGAFRLRMDGATVEDARICFGGMAGTPARAPHAEKALTGKPLTEATVRGAMAAMEGDYAPLTDMRASAEYRMRTAQNLLLRFLFEREETAEAA